LATGVLVEAGVFEGGVGERDGDGVEEQEVGLEVAGLVGDEGMFASAAIGELADGAVADGGGVAGRSAADVDANDMAVDAAGAGVIASAIGAGFPGHGEATRKRRRRERRYTKGAAGRSGRADADEI
jgi:hypothetical protein